MRIINENDLENQHWQCSQGKGTMKRLPDTPGITIGVSVIAPNSKVPDEPHVHERHELLFVRKGTVEVHVGQETRVATSGDYIIFEPYEGHTLTTGEEEVFFFEVFWK
jgi:quercetin dioxygenase-like cupin family protein